MSDTCDIGLSILVPVYNERDTIRQALDKVRSVRFPVKLVCNLTNGLHITDMNTYYKMMRPDVARRVNLVSPGFAMEPEITTKLARLGVHIREHPITYRPRGEGEGKKIRTFDFVRYLAAMARFRLLD
jgi:hypothetical protein